MSIQSIFNKSIVVMKKIVGAICAALLMHGSLAMAAININSASETELTGLPGIGPAKAKAIAEDRQANGDYETIDQLVRVKGIGMKMVDRLRDEATIDASADKDKTTASKDSAQASDRGDKADHGKQKQSTQN